MENFGAKIHFNKVPIFFFYFSSSDLNGIWIFLDLSMNFMQFYRFRADRGPRHQNCTFTNEK